MNQKLFDYPVEFARLPSILDVLLPHRIFVLALCLRPFVERFLIADKVSRKHKSFHVAFPKFRYLVFVSGIAILFFLIAKFQQGFSSRPRVILQCSSVRTHPSLSFSVFYSSFFHSVIMLTLVSRSGRSIRVLFALRKSHARITHLHLHLSNCYELWRYIFFPKKTEIVSVGCVVLSVSNSRVSFCR